MHVKHMSFISGLSSALGLNQCPGKLGKDAKNYLVLFGQLWQYILEKPKLCGWFDAPYLFTDDSYSLFRCLGIECFT